MGLIEEANNLAMAWHFGNNNNDWKINKIVKLFCFELKNMFSRYFEYIGFQRFFFIHVWIFQD